jgi:hypothetical protein
MTVTFLGTNGNTTTFAPGGSFDIVNGATTIFAGAFSGITSVVNVGGNVFVQASIVEGNAPGPGARRPHAGHERRRI